MSSASNPRSQKPAMIPLILEGTSLDTSTHLHHQRFVPVEYFVARGVRAPRRAAQPNLSMHGRSPHGLLRDVERWHRALAYHPTEGPGAWSSSGITGFEWESGVEGETLEVWRIRELLSFEALRAEGARMRHCVAIYGRDCAANRCSIWSMERVSFDGLDPRVTIEVSRDGDIVQVRGKANRLATAEEVALIRKWAAQEGLQPAAVVG